MDNETREIELDKLMPFSLHSDSSTYKGERLEQLMSSIEEHGLLAPIIVRPISDDKYEIICGHNRVTAVKTLGHNAIKAEVRIGLSDDEAKALYFDSNLNQQNFADWSYSQKIEAIKYIDKLIKENSQQGKRNDLYEKKTVNAQETTSVYDRQKLDSNSDRSTTRDKMSRRCGISPSTFSKYRSLIKIPDDMLNSIVQLLDQKKIPFEAAYIISKFDNSEIDNFIDYANKETSYKIDISELKKLSKAKNVKKTKGIFNNVLLSRENKKDEDEDKKYIVKRR